MMITIQILKMLVNLNKYKFFGVIIVLLLQSCVYDTERKAKVITDTLIHLKEKQQDTLSNFNDSIQISYIQVNKNTQKVSRVFFFKKGKPLIIDYYLIKFNDSLTCIRAKSDTTKAIYIDLDRSRSSFLYINPSKVYLWGWLKYIKKEKCRYKNNQSDSLFVLTGCDIGFISDYSRYYYYFDKNIHLKKITLLNGKVLYCDKNLLR
jgi:hypothetical protein